MEIDSIPIELFELAAKAATKCLVMSGITGIYNDPENLKEEMKKVQAYEAVHGQRSPAWWCKRREYNNTNKE